MSMPSGRTMLGSSPPCVWQPIAHMGGGVSANCVHGCQCAERSDSSEHTSGGMNEGGEAARLVPAVDVDAALPPPAP
eukprot:78374-Pyramimonas_sp.AAC.1